MKKMPNRMAAIAVLAILVTASIPAVFASSIVVTLNPATKAAKFSSVSSTNIVLTYPANSSLSELLNGYNSSTTLAGTFGGSSEAAHELQGGMDEQSPGVAVRNMTVTHYTKAAANTTALVITKETNITGWVSGVFYVKNGTVTANLHWKSFEVQGQMDMDLEGRMVDVNLVGSALTEPLSGRSLAIDFLTSAFGAGSLWRRPTINFSALDTPLSAWTKNYDAATNTTTFSKTINGQSTFSATINDNGQKYTLSAVSDPSGEIRVQGYAQPNGDSLVIQSAPADIYSPTVVGGIAAVVVAAILLVAYAVYRSKRSNPIAGTAPSEAQATTPA
jgi:hypothetical protein